MCEVTAGAAQSTPSRRPRRRGRGDVAGQGTATSTPSPCGWDIPPPVASPLDPPPRYWKPRKCAMKTPQRLATFQASDMVSDDRESGVPSASESFSCAPLIWKQKYIAIALTAGELVLFGNGRTKDSKTALGPVATLPLPNDATIVALVQSAIPSLIFAMSVEGDVHQVCLEQSNDSKEEGGEGGKISLSLISSWTTGQHGTTCLTVIDSDQLYIGYKSGHIEKWDVATSSGRRVTRHNFRLTWRGILDDSVRSIAYLSKKQEEGDKQPPTVDLVVTLQALGGTEPPTIQVLNLEAIREAVQTPGTFIGNESLTLSPFCLLESPGMEFVNPRTLPLDEAGLPKRTTPLPSRGTNVACQLRNGRCAVAMSDGTVALVAPGWGVEDVANQFLLSYPAIGCARLNWDKEEHVVCCLRGGTCYVLPSSTSCNEEAGPIQTISYPHDIDSDVTNLYVQDFTAGLLDWKPLDLADDSDSSGLLPVLVFAWAGGVIDVYGCELQSSSLDQPLSTEKQVIGDLLVRQCLPMVLQLFEKMNQNKSHPLNADQRWVDACEEARSLTLSSEASIDDIASTFALRRLLLDFANA